MKKIRKSACILLILFSFVITSASDVMAMANSENGTWKKAIRGTTWYFDVNDYTSRVPGSKYYGMVYIYKGKTNLNNHEPAVSVEYSKVGKNKFKIKYSGGTITFKVNKKSMILKQVRGTVKGRKLIGRFKLVRRHYS